jgi:xanthine dehydrogenase small subunit
VAETLRFWINDELIEEADLPGTTTLLRYLRDQRGLTGTKEGCAEGDCGACTVAILEERDDGPAQYRAVNACLLFLGMLQGQRLFTVEALGRRASHPVQAAMVDARASQCGYCTPGIVMSLFEACYRPDMTADWQVDDQLCGNLCRCTGYRPIRAAGRQVAGLCPDDAFQVKANTHVQGDPSLDYRAPAGPLHPEQRYLQPTTLDALFSARATYPEAVLVAGGTDLGLSVTKRYVHYSAVIGLDGIGVLRAVERSESGWCVGAGVTLTRVMETVGAEIPALHKMLRVFGSRQIRSRGTLGGNLCNASPIGDMAPVLVALDAVAIVAGPHGRRSVPMSDFFTGYRQTAMAGDEILAAVEIPHPEPGSFHASYKVSKRRELDISAVAAGMGVQVDADGTVSAIRLAYGGVSALAGARARRTEHALLGRPWTEAQIEAALPHLDVDFAPISDLRGSQRYRSLLVKNLLRGFFEESQREDRDVFVPWPVGTVLAEAGS